MRSLLYTGLLVLLIGACAGDTDQPEERTLPEATEDTDAFGAPFTASDVQPAESLLGTYTHDVLSDSVSATLRGTVNEVCQAKGCWMTIAAGNGEEMTVTFKDYGFFMPKDIDGQEVIMHGIAYTQFTPVDELRHFAEDAGQTPEEIASITEPRRELRFLADGVQLVP